MMLATAHPVEYTICCMLFVMFTSHASIWQAGSRQSYTRKAVKETHMWQYGSDNVASWQAGRLLVGLWKCMHAERCVAGPPKEKQESR